MKERGNNRGNGGKVRSLDRNINAKYKEIKIGEGLGYLRKVNINKV